MGNFMASAMEENFKKTQKFQMETQRIMLERQIQMQNQMRERQMAAQLARTRELFMWLGSFYAIAGVGMIKAFLKTKIMDNIHKYFYLIVFTAYMRQAADLARESCPDDKKKDLTLSGGRCAIPGNELKLPKSFAAFCEENKAVRDMIDTGKGNLQWERDIPPAALSNLENLAKTDFKANLGQIIHDIYQTAHTMFADMPQGDHKKRAKYRFASKTLMRILPADMKGEVEGLIDKKSITLDLYDILGQCTWGQKKSVE